MTNATIAASTTAYLAAVAVMLLLFGCAADVEPTAYRAEASAAAAPCGPDEGLVRDASGAIVHGITQCALCRRFELAYEARAQELGCSAPFPADACVDEGLTDCLVAEVEEWADFSWATSCEQLTGYAARPETYHRFTCGEDCQLTGLPDAYPACCPGTPYALRHYDRCPYWCDGLAQCNADAECEALLAERGPRR